jgi:hypothetical protein
LKRDNQSSLGSPGLYLLKEKCRSRQPTRAHASSAEIAAGGGGTSERCRRGWAVALAYKKAGKHPFGNRLDAAVPHGIPLWLGLAQRRPAPSIDGREPDEPDPPGPPPSRNVSGSAARNRDPPICNYFQKTERHLDRKQLATAWQLLGGLVRSTLTNGLTVYPTNRSNRATAVCTS